MISAAKWTTRTSFRCTARLVKPISDIATRARSESCFTVLRRAALCPGAGETRLPPQPYRRGRDHARQWSTELRAESSARNSCRSIVSLARKASLAARGSLPVCARQADVLSNAFRPSGSDSELKPPRRGPCKPPVPPPPRIASGAARAGCLTRDHDLYLLCAAPASAAGTPPESSRDA